MPSIITLSIKIYVLRDVPNNFGIGYSTLTKWLKEYRENNEVTFLGSGNIASDEQKEIVRLKRELRNPQDALDVLKKTIGILGK